MFIFIFKMSLRSLIPRSPTVSAEDASKTEDANKDADKEKEQKKDGEVEKNGKETKTEESEVSLYS